MKAIHIMTGTVIHGNALGRTVGMPTANLLPDTAKNNIFGKTKEHLPLREGVYATVCRIDNESFIGVTNVGRRPTVDHSAAFTVETYLLDFDRDIYDSHMTVEFYHYLRPVRRFANLAEVKQQVNLDIEKARELLGLLL